MHGAFPTAGWIALALCFGACDGADSDPAWTQRLRVPGAQWQAGALTGGDGPAITAVDVRGNTATVTLTFRIDPCPG